MKETTVKENIGNGSQVLDLEVLKKQYDTLLIQYKQAQADYINYLSDEKKQERKYKVIQGKTFWGTDAISEQSADSLEQCQSLCTSNNKCTGATYNKDKSYCWIRTGDGTISDGMANDYAIIPQEVNHIKIISGLSERLTSINDKILKVIESQNPVYEEQIEERKDQIKTLSSSYKKLMEERKAILSKLKSYENLNQAESEGEINIKKQRLIYIFSVIGIVILIILFFKFLPTGSAAVVVQQGGGSKRKLMLFIAVVFVTLFGFYKMD
jgi:hypothetical protein